MFFTKKDLILYSIKICTNYNLVMNTFISAQEYLQKYGIKPSLQRIAIVEYLMKNRIHPTADEIYNALYIKVPTLSRTTVYNTMKLFTEQGLVFALMIDDKHVRFDIDTSCHAHFLCLGCYHVWDIPLVKQTELLNVSQIGDFLITESHLYYKGYCKNCNNKTVECNPQNNINQ